MASETSELTFVRCPSCRSLVPASASRCRICNNPLEGSNRAGEAEVGGGAGRVRQKTISANIEDLMAAQELPVQDQIPVGGAVGAQAAGSSLGDGGFDDPLGAYLQELEEEPAVSEVVSSTAGAAQSEASDEDDLEAFLDDFDTFGAEEVAKPAPVASVVAAPVSVEPDLDDDILDDFVVSAAVKPEVPQPVKAPEPPPRREPDRQVRPQQARDPKGEVKQQERVSPPAAQPQKQQNHQHRPERERAPKEFQTGRDQRAQGGGNGERREQRGQERDRGDSHKQERRAEEVGRGGHDHGARQQERQQERPAGRAEHQNVGPKTGRMRPGRLFGWLVSFESPDGRAIELREGKFFVTGSSIRGSDLVIEDPSISTPHALMSVNGDNGLLIQDLMSDRGIFVRSGERGQYRREDGPTEVKHGDWLRFGDVEFLVTIVPTKG